MAQVKTVGKIATGHACGTTDGDVALEGFPVPVKPSYNVRWKHELIQLLFPGLGNSTGASDKCD